MCTTYACSTGVVGDARLLVFSDNFELGRLYNHHVGNNVIFIKTPNHKRFPGCVCCHRLFADVLRVFHSIRHVQKRVQKTTVFAEQNRQNGFQIIPVVNLEKNGIDKNQIWLFNQCYLNIQPIK